LYGTIEHKCFYSVEIFCSTKIVRIFEGLFPDSYDPPGTATNVLLNQIKTYLAAGLPSMFGFTVYGSYTQTAATGKIPYPTRGDKIVGGHAIVAVGYDDNIKIKNTNPGAVETTGAILIRNSWGTGWGSSGYGWLPYDYVLKGLAVDWWSLLKNEWVDTGVFKS
jgi:C1A family cysteine protease